MKTWEELKNKCPSLLFNEFHFEYCRDSDHFCSEDNCDSYYFAKAMAEEESNVFSKF